MPMDSSSTQSHHQEVGSQTLESMLAITKEKKPRPAEQSLKCPRCDSTNTKFCYYNNYSLSQPRYFCKSCRRYWTKGGTLRNVPVGGGCRKTKRSSSRRNYDQAIATLPSTTAITSYTYDSNLAIPGFQKRTTGRPGFNDAGFPMCASTDDYGLIDAFRGGFPRGFQNLYGGNGDEGGLGIGMGMGMLNHEMGFMGFEEFGTSIKQEMYGGDGKWGFPWQNVGGDGIMGDLDSTRIGSWNGVAFSNWHGLLNSPLM